MSWQIKLDFSHSGLIAKKERPFLCGRRGNGRGHLRRASVFHPSLFKRRRTYEGLVKEGGILLSVHSDDARWTDKAKDVLKRTGAVNVSSKSEAHA